MLEKLFARLRSWRQGDLPVPAAPLFPTSSANGAGLKTLSGPLTPPPLPADAWSESESGIVITDSGIIILEPPPAPRARPSAAPASTAPTAAPPPPVPKRTLTPGELDWDDVLARARARAEEVAEEVASDPPPPPVPAAARTKTKTRARTK